MRVRDGTFHRDTYIYREMRDTYIYIYIYIYNVIIIYISLYIYIYRERERTCIYGTFPLGAEPGANISSAHLHNKHNANTTTTNNNNNNNINNDSEHTVIIMVTTTTTTTTPFRSGAWGKAISNVY